MVLLNPLAFHDDRAWDTDQPSRLRRALRRVRRAATRLARRAFPRAAILARAERRIARSFVDLCERGVDVCVVYNENEPYLDFLRRALQPVRQQLDSSRRFRLQTVGEADHLLSPLAVQAEVTRVLIHHLSELH